MAYLVQGMIGCDAAEPAELQSLVGLSTVAAAADSPTGRAEGSTGRGVDTDRGAEGSTAGCGIELPIYAATLLAQSPKPSPAVFLLLLITAYDCLAAINQLACCCWPSLPTRTSSITRVHMRRTSTGTQTLTALPMPPLPLPLPLILILTLSLPLPYPCH